MRSWMLLPIALVTIFCCSKSSSEPKAPPEQPWPFAPPSTQPLDAFAMNAKIGRGFNMGNALEANYEGEWGMVIKDEYFRIIAEAGFTSVRLPVTWSAHSMPAPPFLIDEAFFQRVDHVVQEALKNGLVVILNNHHFDALNENPAGNQLWLEALWRQIADRYKNYPDEVYFEILNEPHGAFNSAPQIWNKMAADVLRIIRVTNPYRMVIIGPVQWNSIRMLNTLELPEEDRGIIATFHFYDPFQFTHQGAEWAGSEAMNWLGTKWTGSAAERKAITDPFEAAAAWGRNHNRPLYMGEFGAYYKADDNSRYRWTDFVARTAERLGISWTYWEFGAGFGAYDRDKNAWRPLLLKALMPS
ncbi:MAG: glycoside hydrolase family 5 protein [candidate division KSB1 bacterium]|nr:glycoside hydrolase family 5 protein [candidate division KSB1 bacterium]